MADIKLKSLLKEENLNEIYISPEQIEGYRQFAMNYGLPNWQTAALIIGTSATMLVGGAILAVGQAKMEFDKLKYAFDMWKEGRKLNPDKVKELADNYGNSLKRLEGGEKKYFLGLINRIKKVDPNDKNSIVLAKRDLESYAKSHGLDLSDDDYAKYKQANDDRAAQIAKQNAVSKKRKDARLNLAAKKSNIDLDSEKIKNPETGNDISIKSALSYDEKSPVYKAALQQIQQLKNKSGNNPQKPAGSNLFGKDYKKDR